MPKDQAGCSAFWGAAETVCVNHLLPGAHRGSARAPALEQRGLKASFSCREEEEEEGELSTTKIRLG